MEKVLFFSSEDLITREQKARMTENRSTEALYSEDNTIEEETNQSQMSENSEDLEPIVIQTDEKEDILSKRDYLRYDDDEYDTKSSTDIKIVEDDCYYLFDLAANIDGVYGQSTSKVEHLSILFLGRLQVVQREWHSWWEPPCIPPTYLWYHRII